MPTRIYKIGDRALTPWGDYGDILQHGMTAHLPRVEGQLALERTGPFIPPVTLPGIGDLVLTSPAKQLLESSGLTGATFRPVHKALVVELHWEKWDRNTPDPPLFPDSGEPEDYVLGQPNSPSASAALGDLWEVAVPPTATILRPSRVADRYKDLLLDLNTWNGEDLFRSSGYSAVLFSERARDWFLQQWQEYIDFAEFPTTPEI